MRIDLFLSESGMVSSRTEAKRCIAAGLVLLDGVAVKKPSLDVSGLEERITLLEAEKSFVGRGGVKLDAALDAFGISVDGKKCVDIGASSGGFTDCLLQRGAERVVAIDSGSSQLVESLRRDSRVISVEGYNARYIRPSDLPFVPEIAVMDVSFISATYIIPALTHCLPSGADFVLLIKPQFEVGRENVGKGGIVKSEKIRMMAVDKVSACAESFGFDVRGVIVSPIQGGDGNVEYLAHMIKR